jgi:hypothetical protein
MSKAATVAAAIHEPQVYVVAFGAACDALATYVGECPREFWTWFRRDACADCVVEGGKTEVPLTDCYQEHFRREARGTLAEMELVERT